MKIIKKIFVLLIFTVISCGVMKVNSQSIWDQIKINNKESDKLHISKNEISEKSDQEDNSEDLVNDKLNLIDSLKDKSNNDNKIETNFLESKTNSEIKLNSENKVNSQTQLTSKNKNSVSPGRRRKRRKTPWLLNLLTRDLKKKSNEKKHHGKKDHKNHHKKDSKKNHKSKILIFIINIENHKKSKRPVILSSLMGSHRELLSSGTFARINRFSRLPKNIEKKDLKNLNKLKANLLGKKLVKSNNFKEKKLPEVSPVSLTRLIGR